MMDKYAEKYSKICLILSGSFILCMSKSFPLDVDRSFQSNLIHSNIIPACNKTVIIGFQTSWENFEL